MGGRGGDRGDGGGGVGDDDDDDGGGNGDDDDGDGDSVTRLMAAIFSVLTGASHTSEKSTPE